MNGLSWVILILIIIWFVWASVRIVRNRGGCSCGCTETTTGHEKSSCCGHCMTCGKCNHE